MRILLLTHSFNSLSQRLYLELRDLGHELSIELDVNDATTEQAVALFRPDLILAPFLKRAIPDSLWQRVLCIIVHPGIVGDRGPSSLDWAIMENRQTWGVTCLQAEAEMDAGPVWASVEFPMRSARKASLYRNEVTEAAVQAVKLTLERVTAGNFTPRKPDPLDPATRGCWRDPMTQADRCIDWAKDSTERIVNRIHAADGMPGLLDNIAGKAVYLYNARPASNPPRDAMPGTIVAQREGAICRASPDGGVWISHLRIAHPSEEQPRFKLPAMQCLALLFAGDPAPAEIQTWLSQAETDPDTDQGPGGFREIHSERRGDIGYLYFDFYNGAMSTDQCQRLLAAYRQLARGDSRIIVLMGGEDFWSNGIHLNTIEAAVSPAEESWRNINAMNDLCHAIITTTDKLTIAALRGNAGAGGVFLSLAADLVFARKGVVLNPHYRGMGNLYGSEYWTYLLPRRVGTTMADTIIRGCLPMTATEAARLGLIDDAMGSDQQQFLELLDSRARELLDETLWQAKVDDKRQQRQADEQMKPLQAYRDEELARMRLNFFGFDPSYHFARYHFVEKIPKARTPSYLAHHR